MFRVLLTPVAPAVLAFCLVSLLPVAGLARAQSPPPFLDFRGLQVGISISELRSRVRSLAGTLSCRPSKDPRLDECTGYIRLGPNGPRYTLIVSSVRDSAAVVILSGSASRDRVTLWANGIAEIQGDVSPRDRGPQRTWQWVRYRQMLRLIHRREDSGTALTVTLTDGPLLDNLGAPPHDGARPPPS